MQLIPSTALATARKEGLRYSKADLIEDPLYNMMLGSAHLSHLLERFDGSLIMTMAAYNAGPHRVDQWVKTYGDPRTSQINPLDWIELIPFNETRNYVQRVLENMQIYRARMSDQPIAGKLAMDIERGGRAGRVASIKEAPAVLVALSKFEGEQTITPLPARTGALLKSISLEEIVAQTHASALLPDLSALAPATSEDINTTDASVGVHEQPAAPALASLTPVSEAPKTKPVAAATHSRQQAVRQPAPPQRQRRPRRKQRGQSRLTMLR